MNAVDIYVASEGAISIFLRYESKMSDIDKWLEIAKECKYLPENDLKVNNVHQVLFIIILFFIPLVDTSDRMISV